MASPRGIKAGAAYVELLVKDNQLVRGLENAGKKLKAFGAAVGELGTKLAGIGAAMLAPLGASAKVFADMGDSVAKMSRRTGVSTEALSELGFAAEQSGTDLETLEKSLRKMQRTIVDAAGGTATAQEALDLLGIRIQELDGLSPEQQFKLIADRLAGITDPTIKAALAMELFGRSGTALLPMMADGAEGIERLQEQARNLGLTIRRDDAAAAEVLSDTLNITWRVLKQGAFIIGSALAPALNDLANGITGIVVHVSAWLKQNKQLVVTVLKVSAAVLAGGLALVGLGYGVSALGMAMGAVATIITGVGSAIGILGTVLGAILSPIGLVITGVAALGAYVLYATDVGAKALAWLGEKFTMLRDAALQAYQGIADALAAGDIALAARILWLSLKLAWDNGVAQLQRIWLAFRGFFVKVGYGAFYGVLAAAEFLWHSMKVVWIEGVAFLKKVWANFVSWHAQAVEATADAMVRSWIWAREKTGSITAQQAAYERQAARQQHEQAGRQIDRELKSSLAGAEGERDAGRQAEQQRHDARLAEVGKRYNDAAASVEAQRAEKQRKTEEALAAARKEWQDAIAEARRKRQGKEAEDKGPPGLSAAPDIDDLAEKLGGLGDLLDQKTKATIGVAGTFNAMEARGLGGGGVTDRIANATEATAKNTKKLLDRARDGELAFE